MGIRDKPIAPGSPWQNGFAERLIGSIRRECVDHIIVLGEAHLRQVLNSYGRYYNRVANSLLDKPIAPASPWQNAFAETADRIDPARVRRPYNRF